MRRERAVRIEKGKRESGKTRKGEWEGDWLLLPASPPAPTEPGVRREAKPRPLPPFAFSQFRAFPSQSGTSHGGRTPGSIGVRGGCGRDLRHPGQRELPRLERDP